MSNHQICATVSTDLINEISEIAERENRTFSQTVALLLHKAVKEKNRKRKNAKESSVQNHTSNSR